MAVLQQILVLFLLIFVGVLTSKLNIVHSDFKKDLSKFLLYVTVPAFLITAMGANFTSENPVEVISNSYKLILISLLMYALAIALSFLLAKIFKFTIDERNVMQFSITFSNVAFMGYPIIDIIYGSEGVFYAAIYNLTFNILIWTLGVVLITRGKSVNNNTNPWMKIINPGVVAIIIGFILFIFNIQLPYALGEGIRLVGNLTTPLAMIFIGLSLSDVSIMEIVSDYRGFVISIFRLGIFPGIFYLVLSIIGCEGYMLTIPVIISAMPVAINGSMFAMTFESDYVFASKLVFLSSFLSLITIPLIIEFLA